MRGFIAARGFIGDLAARRAARASSRMSRSLRDRFGAAPKIFRISPEAFAVGAVISK
tara:strand:+ start:40 stop:210 length:171 start_codon:yes stop_codon:yes gene_type:complete